MGGVLLLQHDSVFSRYGGVQYYLHDLCDLSNEVLGESNFLSLIPDRGDSRNENVSYRTVKVPYPRSGLLAKASNRIPWPLYREAGRRLAQGSYDLLVCSHVSLAPLGYALSRRVGIPYAVVVYGTDCWGDLWPQDEWALKRASRIFSISEWTKSVLVERGYAAENVRIVHPRIFEGFEKIAPPARQTGKALELLCVARLDPRERYKGQDDVLEALAGVRKRSPELDFNFTLVGDGADGERLAALTERLGLNGRVHFKPAVKSRDELAAIYAASDLYVMPSRFGKWDGQWRGEGFGIVYAEAAVFEVPSVAYRCGGVMDIVRDRETGWLLPPDSVSALSKCLEHLITTPQWVREIGVSARADVLSRFTRNAVRAELASAFEHCFYPQRRTLSNSPYVPA